MKQFATQQPDLVVTDIFMPEKEGLSTIMDAKKADPAVKIIAMSGGGRVWNMDTLPVALKLGADAVLYKPFRREKFLGLVGDLLREAACKIASFPGRRQVPYALTFHLFPCCDSFIIFPVCMPAIS